MTLRIVLEMLFHILQGTVKNPKSAAKEVGLLVQIRDYINSILYDINSGNADHPDHPSNQPGFDLQNPGPHPGT